MNSNQFIEELEKINVRLTEKQLEQLEIYYELLVSFNKVMNLTGITEKNDVYLKHFYDSLTIVKAIDLSSVHNIADIGTGAGFPGLVLKIVYPQLKVTLVDSLNKRLNFLKEVINKLELQDIEIVHSRAEEFIRKNEFDMVTCRAVSHLRIILEYCIPLVKVNGYFIPLKANIENEVVESKNALSKLESEIVEIYSFELPFEKSKRNIIKIKKNKINNSFPRKFSDIKNKPL